MQVAPSRSGRPYTSSAVSNLASLQSGLAPYQPLRRRSRRSHNMGHPQKLLLSTLPWQP